MSRQSNLNAIFRIENFLHFTIAELHVFVKRLKRFRNFAAVNLEPFLQYQHLRSSSSSSAITNVIIINHIPHLQSSSSSFSYCCCFSCCCWPPAGSGIVYNFGHICLSVCMYVCQTINCESPDVRSSYLHIWCISRSRSQDQKGRKCIFPQSKTSISHNSAYINTEPRRLCVAWGFWLCEIEWCDCHLCNVTGSGQA